jgi:hypothetical protein
MGKHLDVIRRFDAEPRKEGLRQNDQSDQRGVGGDFGRLCRFGRATQAGINSFISYPRPVSDTRLREVLRILEGRCPDHVDIDRWQRAVADGQRFLSQWGEQAQALGWTSRDLFGLHTPPDNPAQTYRRLSRYDCTGLVWLLQSRPVMALTDATAAIQNPTGNVTVYCKNNKPALGRVGDSLDDFR